MAMARYWEWERTVARELPEVISSGRIEILFQPIYRLHQGLPAARGFEALARFPTAPRIPLGLWFRTAREMGITTQLEMEAIRAIFKTERRIPGEAFLCVNASVDSLPLLAGSIPSGLQGRVIVDLPYSALTSPGIDDSSELLRASGAGVAIDDVALEDLELQRDRILELRPDCVKVDVAEGVAATGRARSDLVAAVEWCNQAGITLMAERVERVTDLAVLEASGVKWAQGLSLSPPLEL
jgi:EAL domain-containing protein (putative c-di-GMP-specific phosphodiesterase class I)